MIDNNWHKKEKPMLSMGGLGGGAFQQALLSSGVVLGSRSLRFNDGDSASLSKTFSSAGNRRTFTFSCWVKRCTFGVYQTIISAGNSSPSQRGGIRFRSDDKLEVTEDSLGFDLRTSRVFRDPSAWYHIVVAVDTTQGTASNRIKLYINGVEEDAFDSSSYPSQNFDCILNSGDPHRIGELSYAGNIYELDGYLTEIFFIDGSQLEPTSFGEFDNSGVWQEKNYIGTKNQNPSFGLSASDIVSSTGFQSGEGADKVIDTTDPTANRAHTVAGNAGETLTVTFNPAVTVNTSLEIYAYLTVSGDSEERRARVNGGDWFNPSSTADTYHDLNFTGTLSTIQIQYNGSVNSRSMTMRGIRIDGVFVHTGGGGTNSFHLLDFANTGTIGNDTSGNENNFTATGFSEVAGAGNDVLFDVPTNDTENTDSGAGGEVIGNYACINPLLKPDTQTVTLSNGNLDFSSGAASGQYATRFSSIGVTSGKWYAEFTVGAVSNGIFFGVSRDPNGDSNFIGGHSTSFGYVNNGSKYTNGSAAGYGDSFTANDVIGVALDLDSGTLTFYKNGSSQGTAYNSMGTGTFFIGISGTGSATAVCNFGQRPFEYAAPANHKCLTTTSLPTPTIADGSDYFDIDLYTGTGSTHERSEFSFSPDLVWIKQRNTTRNNLLFDIVRGANKFAVSNSSGTPGTGSGMVTSFDSDGFTVGNSADVNQSSGTFAAWCWDGGTSTVSNTDGTITSSVRANQTAGFSIATFTTPSSGTFSFGHGLSAAPELIIAKATNQSYSWVVYAKPVGNDKYLVLNTTAAEATGAIWNNTTPTSSVVSGNSSNFGTSTDYVAYCISPVASYSAVGSYVGNGSADGPFVHCGFKPAFIIIKGASSGGTNYNWAFVDTERSYANVANHTLAANLGNGESYFGDGSSVFGPNNKIDILSNGFKPRENATFHNTDGVTYLFYAVAENPFQANGGIAR